MPRQSSRVFLWILIGSLLLFAVTGVAIGSSGVAAQPSNESNETIPPHINPDEIAESADIDQLATVLEGSLDETLAGSLRNLNQDDYQQAQRLLEEDYEANLTRYREVAAELDREEQAELYRLAKTDQAAFVDAVEQFETTEQAYQQARLEGDDQRARSLGRQLVATADRVNTTGNNTATAYQTLGEATRTNYTEQVAAVTETQADAAATSQEVVSAEFIETRLSASADQSSISFRDTLTIRGSLQTVDDQSLPAQEIQLAVDGRQYTVDPTSNGEFTLSIQPATVWETNTSPLEIRYIPTNESVYLGSQDRVSVTIETTATDVDIESNRDIVDFDTMVTANGSVTTEELTQPVPSVPVALRVDGTEIATAETTRNGRFQLRGEVPPDLPAGETTASAVVRPSALALEESDATTRIEIQPTDTTTTVTAQVAEQSSTEQAIQLTGTVVSAAGRPVANMPVVISRENTEIEEFETNSGGQFSGTIESSETAASGTTISLTAEFNPADSHLQSSTATTTVELSEEPSDSLSGEASDSIFAPLLAALRLRALAPLWIGLTLLSGVVGLFVFRQRWQTKQTAATADSAVEDDGSETYSEPTESEKLLTTAAAALENDDYTSATTLAYTAVRYHLSAEVDVGDNATLREWHQACKTKNIANTAALDSLVEAFEYVVYAPTDETTSTMAGTALSSARELLDTER